MSRYKYNTVMWLMIQNNQRHSIWIKRRKERTKENEIKTKPNKNKIKIIEQQ